MQEITSSDEFSQKVLNFKGKVLVDFWAPWCGPCRVLTPVIDQVAEDFAGRADIAIVKVNIDKVPDLAQKYDVQAIPTVSLFENGELKQTLQGLRGKQDYLDLLS